jgi:hypothetical protein
MREYVVITKMHDQYIESTKLLTMIEANKYVNSKVIEDKVLDYSDFTYHIHRLGTEVSQRKIG